VVFFNQKQRSPCKRASLYQAQYFTKSYFSFSFAFKSGANSFKDSTNFDKS